MKKLISFMAIAAMVFTSCTKDEDEEVERKLEGKNTVKIEFDNGFKNDKLLLGTTYTNGNQEKLTVSAFDYIVSNFILVTEDGKEFVYPKENGSFIISEGGKTKKRNVKITLNNVPAGKYTKIKFGIGIDQKRYKEGKAAQKKFWEKAESYSLTWSWQAGYKFVVLEGDFTSPKQSEKKNFWLHIASRGTTIDLYKEVALPMEVALVDAKKSPLIHVKVDANKMLDGKSKIKLSEGNSIMGGDKAGIIAENNKDLFMVHHVHNGHSGEH